MAVKYGYLEESDFTNIADAIREKNSGTTKYKPNEMPAAIKAISTVVPDTADATATANDVLTGKTAYVNGVKVTGTIPELTATTYNPSDTEQTIASGQYISETQTIAAVTANNIPSSLKESKTVTGSLTEDVNVTPTTGKVLTGVTVNKPDMSDATATALNIQRGATAYGADGTLITGTHDETTITEMTSDATASANDILTGKTAYVNGSKISGTIQEKTKIDTTIVPGGSTTIESGYYSEDGSVSASLATTVDQIDSTLKTTGTTQTIVPGGSATVSGGKYYTSDNTVAASLATTVDQIDSTIKESKTVTASLTDVTEVTPTTNKVLTSVTVNAPDMSSADVTADDIVSGKKAYGADGTLITGTHEEAGGTDTSDATATAADILSGKTAYVADGKVTGTLEVLNYYASTADPTSDVGEVGELYIKLQS